MLGIEQPNWDVLLIGGHSTSGKSTVARKLGQHFGVSVSQVDDYRLVLQRATSPGQIDGLHFFSQDPAVIFANPLDSVVEQLIRIGKIMSDALEDVIAHHVITHTPIILEGDGILPALAILQEIDGVSVTGKIKSVFIVESSEQAFFQSCRERWPGSEADSHTSDWVRLAWRYGQWLCAETQKLGLPIVKSQPWDMLGQRILAELSMASGNWIC